MDRKRISDLNYEDFLLYYFYKDEMVDFCRENNLDTRGGKLELKERIYRYKRFGIKEKSKQIKKVTSKNEGEYHLKRRIGENFACTQKAREFFENHVGKEFKFKVKFQKYLKENPDKKLEDAINYWKYKRDKKGQHCYEKSDLEILLKNTL